MDGALGRSRLGDGVRAIAFCGSRGNDALLAVGTREGVRALHVPTMALVWEIKTPAPIESLLAMPSGGLAAACSDWAMYTVPRSSNSPICTFRSTERAISKPASGSLRLRPLGPSSAALACLGRSSVIAVSLSRKESAFSDAHRSTLPASKAYFEGRRSICAVEGCSFSTVLFASHSDGSVRAYRLSPTNAKQLDLKATVFLPPENVGNKQPPVVARCLLYMPERHLLIAGDGVGRAHAWIVAIDSTGGPVSLSAAWDSYQVSPKALRVSFLIHAGKDLIVPHLADDQLAEPLSIDLRGGLSTTDKCSLRSLSVSGVAAADFHPSLGMLAVGSAKGDAHLLRGWLAQRQIRHRLPSASHPITHLATAAGSAGQSELGQIHYQRKTLMLNGSCLSAYDLFHGEETSLPAVSGLEGADELCIERSQEHALVICNQGAERRVAVTLRRQPEGAFKKVDEVECSSATFARSSGAYVASIEHDGRSIAVRQCQGKQTERFVFHLDLGVIANVFPGPMDATLTVERSDGSLFAVWLQKNCSAESVPLSLLTKRDERVVHVCWQPIERGASAGAILTENRLVLVLASGRIMRVLGHALNATSFVWFGTALLYTKPDGSVTQLCWDGANVGVRDVAEPGCILHTATADRLVLVVPSPDGGVLSGEEKILQRQFSPAGCLLLGHGSLAKALHGHVGVAAHMYSAISHTLLTLGVDGVTLPQMQQLARCGFGSLAARIEKSLGRKPSNFDCRLDNNGFDGGGVEIRKRRDVTLTASDPSESAVEVAQLNSASTEDGLRIIPLDEGEEESEDSRPHSIGDDGRPEKANDGTRSRRSSTDHLSNVDDVNDKLSLQGDERNESTNPSTPGAPQPSALGAEYPGMGADSDSSDDNDDGSMQVSHSRSSMVADDDDDEEGKQRQRSMVNRIRIKSELGNVSAQSADLRKAAANALFSIASSPDAQSTE